MFYAQKLRERIQNGHVVAGTNTLFAGASTSAIMAHAGSEFIWIDMEHGPMDYKDAYEHVLAAHAGGAAALIRVPANDPDLLKKTLDLGADGVIFPLVKSAEEVRMMISACLYPPDGIRGWNPLGIAGYGTIGTDVFYRESSSSVLKFIMLEHMSAYKELDQILQVQGLDGVILGPCDFSGSVNRMLDIDAPEVVQPLEDAVRKCNQAGLIAGIALGCRIGSQAYERWIKAGVRLFSVGQDMDLIYTATQGKLKELRACVGSVTIAAASERGYDHVSVLV